jgi:hypothetical protein
MNVSIDQKIINIFLEYYLCCCIAAVKSKDWNSCPHRILSSVHVCRVKEEKRVIKK